MADLTRLRAIVANSDDKVAFAAGVLYHLSGRPHQTTLRDVESVRSSLRWLASAPIALFGDVVGQCGFQPDDFSGLSDTFTDSLLADVATLANAMLTPDADWDRTVRNDNAVGLAHHGALAARLETQSPAEFAVLDVLQDAGYPGIEAAVAAFADIKRSHPQGTYTMSVRQYARSRHAICARIVSAGRLYCVVTPWCLSRRSAQAYAAVALRALRRTQIEQRAIDRARTAVSYASRHSLQALRDITDPAIALLTQYTYSSRGTAFVDERGMIRQSIQSRSPSVWVAFATVHMNGSCDFLMELARKRTSLTTSLPVPDNHRLAEYYDHADDPLSGLLAFSRVLASFRDERDNGPYGPRLNKGPMLGYVARAVSKRDRNTVACINRIEEVYATLLSQGHDRSRLLFVVEWGGDYSHAAVLAAAAAAQIDVAIDIAGSGVDLPGDDVMADDQDFLYSFSLYLSSARRRKLPRMPSVEYVQGTPLHQRLVQVYDSVGGTSSDYSLAYISGGVAHMGELPVTICSDSAIRMASLKDTATQLPLVYHTAEVLLPSLCHHGVAADHDTYLDTGSAVDPECPHCDSHYRAVSLVSSCFVDPGVRLVKPRSIFGHNAHFSVESCAAPVPGVEHTLDTIDSAIACNVLRNHGWASAPVSRNLGADPVSSDLADDMKSIISWAYTRLSERYPGRMSDSDADTIAASIT
uniref:Uncharacterized protein n=1 Tax=Pseudopestalotiopsis camelliae-sinensis polymycovirus 1 TaxID=3367397 RepID=A0AB74ULM2_9VIRU